MIKSLTPDFAIIDLQLPKLHGLEVFCKVQTNSVCKLVVLTINRDEKMVRDALRAGANGYVKDGPARTCSTPSATEQWCLCSPLLRPDDPYPPPRSRDSDDDPDEAVAYPSPRRPRRPPKAGGAGAPSGSTQISQTPWPCTGGVADAKGASKWEAMESARVLTWWANEIVWGPGQTSQP
jgi:hypothetical protein